MLDLLQELLEARMYRGADTLKGKTATELSHIAYLMIMMLEIMRTEDPKFARNYVTSSIAYENFEAMRNNATDLHNLLSVLNNQDKFEERIEVNHNISVPVLQIKRYFRDIVSGNKEPGLDKQLFLKLENFFKISNPAYKHVRRSVGDWNSCSKSEKSSIRNELKTMMQNTSQQNDIFVQFKNLVHSQEI